MAKQLLKVDTTGAYRAKNAKRAAHVIRETVLLGDWEEVQDINAQTIRPDLSAEKLNGLILKGYEMKWGNTNENGEQYDQTAFDDFIKRYFVDGKMNMPVDVNHEGWKNWHAYCGRVLYIEVNSVGFYFVCYIPKGIDGYDDIKLKIQEGILQGLSKEGWSTKGKIFRDPKTGDFSYYLVEEMEMLGVSLVTTPANGNPLEKAKEIKNGLQFIKRQDNAPEVDAFGAMFN